MLFSKYVVECDNDKTLVQELLNIRSGRIHHALGKTNVLKVLQKSENSLGLIDEDPESHQPPMLRSIQVNYIGNGIKVGQFRSNKLVILCPELEEWVVRAIEEIANLNPKIDAKTLKYNPEMFRKSLGRLIQLNSSYIITLRNVMTTT